MGDLIGLATLALSLYNRTLPPWSGPAYYLTISHDHKPPD